MATLSILLREMVDIHKAGQSVPGHCCYYSLDMNSSVVHLVHVYKFYICNRVIDDVSIGAVAAADDGYCNDDDDSNGGDAVAADVVTAHDTN